MEFRINKKLLMGGITVDVDEEHNPARTTREDRNSPANSLVRPNHRRSKSATDRKLDNPVGGASRKDFNDLNQQSPTARTSWPRSPLQEYSASSNTNTSPSNRASLEQDIEQLQSRLQQEKSMRMMLERAMGRASSTLSPGHRHFSAQTKELVDEIELLEEEVASREQHVLALYRSIFDHCVSQPTSQQSSVTSSPAHKMNESRKHPSIISSSFCSSKNFHLQPFRALASMNDSKKRGLKLQSKTSHLSLPAGKPMKLLEKARSNHCKVQKLQPKIDKTSVLRTLKDHLHQCPSKLSEEMVRCMAAVYCWLHNSASVNLDRKESPLLSRSSTNFAHPRSGISQNRGWFCKSTVEISTISTNKKHFASASYAINNYRALVEQLERVNVTQMETNAKIAFWINTYNSLVMHAYLAYGTPHGSLRRLALFHKAAYNISGCIVSANAIEQAIFCFRTPRVGRWFEIILSTAMRKRSREERHRISSKFSISDSPSLVSLALCTGAFSDPMLKVYTPSNVREELEETAREFLQSNVVVKDSKKVLLPKVLERFAKESSMASDDLINWVSDNVDKNLRESIQNCIDRKTSRKASQVIEWLPYSLKFRYMLSKELLEKPWWV